MHLGWDSFAQVVV
jgi:hypothetical protein